LIRCLPGASHSVPQRLRPLGELARREIDGALLDAVVAPAVVVALAVGAAAQARLREHLLVELALLAQLDLRLEDLDLAREVGGHAAAEALLPGGGALLHGAKA
jgi:hypothetical protein